MTSTNDITWNSEADYCELFSASVFVPQVILCLLFKPDERHTGGGE